MRAYGRDALLLPFLSEYHLSLPLKRHFVSRHATRRVVYFVSRHQSQARSHFVTRHSLARELFALWEHATSWAFEPRLYRAESTLLPSSRYWFQLAIILAGPRDLLRPL